MERLNICLALSFALITLVIALPPHLGGRIVGGYEADIKNITFQVSLQSPNHFCGGSLIAKHYVLTAAHCTDGKSISNPDFKVRIASKYSTKEGIIVKPIKIYQHEQYNSYTIDYDFSVLRLDDYDDNLLPFKIKYVKLPENDYLKDGMILTVSGWGNTQNSAESNNVLRAVNVPKVNKNVCAIAYKGFASITDQMLCAGQQEGGKDACQGDSGGPLFKDNVIWGVVSWGYGCARPKYPGVYSRVTSALEWIKTIMTE